MSQPSLHPSIVAMVSLAANVASNHPKQGLCQVERLRGMGVPDEQIDMVVDIARHLRDEAAQTLDAGFDTAFAADATRKPEIAKATAGASCCTPTAKGNSCC
jgi:uncharacterized BrkB/YihY/UPF0761 family membrane protein